MPGSVAPTLAIADRSAFEQALWCGFYGTGVVGTLLIYGLTQERIMTIPYAGPDGSEERFTYSVFPIFLNRIGAVLFSLAMALHHKEGLGSSAPLWKYLVVSLSNVFASSCQYEALKYVSFAVQMLGKSFKMLPVMVWGMAINRKSYCLQDWLIAATVTGGVTEFLMTGPTQAPTSTPNSFVGLMWLLAFLVLDGLTSTMQEKLFKEHKVSKYNQMMYVNSLSAVVSFFTLWTSGTLFPALHFFFSHGRFAADALTLSGSAVCSQFFIYSQVQEFGALVFAATMNVRQIASIIVSYVTYHHSITPLQVLGLTLVFTALFYKSTAALREAASKEKAALLTPAEESQVKALQGYQSTGDEKA